MNLQLARRAIAGSAFLLAVCCCPTSTHAQSNVQTYGGQKFLVIQREVTKPGRDGSPHQATEAAYMRAAVAGKAPFHYVAFTSISGPNRAIFMSGYPSLEAMEVEHKQMSAALQTSLDKAMVADGDLLSEQSGSVWMVDPDLSQNTNGPRVGSRYMVVREYVVKPGHEAEWNKLVKMVLDGYQKADVGAHWSTYRLVFGNSTGPTFLVLTSIKSLSEVDQMFAADPKFMEAVGEDGIKKLDELDASCVQSEMSNIFALDPKMSIPTDDMVKAEPDFWRAKPAVTGTAKKTSTVKLTTSSGQ